MKIRAYKFRIYPNQEQKVLLAKSFGCTRFIYNWALNKKTSLYKKEKTKISNYTLINEIVKLKKEDETVWLSEVNAQSLQNALMNLDKAFIRFFKAKKGFPKFKSKHDKQSFANPQRTNIDFDKGKIYIPKFPQGIKCIFDRRFEGKIKTSTVSKTKTGKYYISILAEIEGDIPNKKEIKQNSILGIDLGIKSYATYSDGTIIDNPKLFSKYRKQLAKSQRKMSRMKTGSKNREKQRQKVALIHEKIANCRKDFLHKLTRKIVDNQDYDSVAIEDLSVESMNKDKRLARSIADASWGMFRQFLTYKCDWYGKNLLVIGQFEPSSKLCECGYLNHQLTLDQREWTCPQCQVTNDRDLLAARNIRRFSCCKQDTSKISKKDKKISKKSLGWVTPESTLGEIGAGRSVNQECLKIE